jgi:hypothetical protein
LFAANGEMLLCTDKCKLIHLLTKLGEEEEPRSSNGDLGEQQASDTVISTSCGARQIALVDGMVLIQKMAKKPPTVVTVEDLSKYFNDKLISLTRDYDEVIVVFDTYKSDSLKNTTWKKRRKDREPIRYQVLDDTSIKHVPMSRFLSHDQTKADLTDYLASKIIEYNYNSTKVIVVCASGMTTSNTELQFDGNNHEEADTLLIYQSVLATQRNPADAQLMGFFTRH